MITPELVGPKEGLHTPKQNRESKHSIKASSSNDTSRKTFRREEGCEAASGCSEKPWGNDYSGCRGLGNPYRFVLLHGLQGHQVTRASRYIFLRNLRKLWLKMSKSATSDRNFEAQFVYSSPQNPRTSFHPFLKLPKGVLEDRAPRSRDLIGRDA